MRFSNSSPYLLYKRGSLGKKKAVDSERNLFLSSNWRVKNGSGGIRAFTGLVAEIASLAANGKENVDRIRSGDLEFRFGQCLSDLYVKVLLISLTAGRTRSG